MKIRVEKKGSSILITLEYSSSKKPVTLTLTETEADVVIGLLKTAKSAESFTFEYEVR